MASRILATVTEWADARKPDATLADPITEAWSATGIAYSRDRTLARSAADTWDALAATTMPAPPATENQA